MSHTRTFGRKYLRFQYKWHRRHNDDEDFSINYHYKFNYM